MHKERLTVIQSRRGGDESLAGRTFQAGVGGGSSVADALQVVMPEGRTPGRHDGRDAEVRRFSPLPLRRHPSSRARDVTLRFFALRVLLLSLLPPSPRLIPPLERATTFLSSTGRLIRSGAPTFTRDET